MKEHGSTKALLDVLEERNRPDEFGGEQTRTQKEIVEILNAARKSGSVQLTGSSEARKVQLQALRHKDLTQLSVSKDGE